MKSITIRGRTLSVPILQGGMGIGVSLGGLAGAVAACGGMGTISTAVTGFNEPDFYQNPFEANLRALEREIRKAKELAGGAGMVAINAMVATTQYADSIRTAIRAGVDAVVCGAGLAVDLPAIADGADVALAPIVSSPRAAATLCKLWRKRFDRLPDFMVVEADIWVFPARKWRSKPPPVWNSLCPPSERNWKDLSKKPAEPFPCLPQAAYTVGRMLPGWSSWEQPVFSLPPVLLPPTNVMLLRLIKTSCWLQSQRMFALCTALLVCRAGHCIRP